MGGAAPTWWPTRARVRIERFHRAYPTLASHQFSLDRLDIDHLLHDADAVLVYDWNDPALVAAIGHHRATTGEVVRRRYLEMGWAERAWTWHEAADHRLFRPLDNRRLDGDLVWIGSWGDEARTAEIEEFLLEPATSLGLRTRVHGVRFPRQALARLERGGVDYSG